MRLRDDRLRDDRLSEIIWSNWYCLELLQQLGEVPRPASEDEE